MAFTNIVACIPLDVVGGNKIPEPLPEHIEACRPRLDEFIALAGPRLIVTVGKLATDWLDPKAARRGLSLVRAHADWEKGVVQSGPDVPRVDVVHPAAILRSPTAGQGLAKQRCEVTIRDACEEYL